MSEPSLETKVARGVAWAAAGQAIIAIGDIVSNLVVFAMIPTKDLGIAYFAVPFYAMLDTAADLGIAGSLIQRDDHTPERVSTVFWLNMMVSAALFVLLIPIGTLYGRLLGSAVAGSLLIAYGSKLFFQNVYAIPFALLRKELRFNDIAIARTISHLCESAARVVFVMAGMTVWVLTFSAFVRAFVFGVIIQIRHPFIPRLVFKPREVIPYVRFGLRSAASQVLYQLYTNLDYAVVGYYFGKHANGIYAAAYTIVLEPVRTITNVVSDVAFPTFAKLRDDRAALGAQFIKFTRLNVIAVLPFIAIIALVIPEFGHVFFGRKQWDIDDWWTRADYVLLADAVRILCLVGLLRALGFLGPPLLDGIGHPERTLRYMVVAAFVLTSMYLIGASTLGGRLGLLSVALAWAAGYPLAFAVLAYLVVQAIDLPLRDYGRQTWGLVACCAAGFAVGLVVSHAMSGGTASARLAIVGGSALLTIATLFATWQKLTPATIRRAMKG